jgi:hypothetical protein
MPVGGSYPAAISVAFCATPDSREAAISKANRPAEPTTSTQSRHSESEIVGLPAVANEVVVKPRTVLTSGRFLRRCHGLDDAPPRQVVMPQAVDEAMQKFRSLESDGSLQLVRCPEVVDLPSSDRSSGSSLTRGRGRRPTALR